VLDAERAQPLGFGAVVLVLLAALPIEAGHGRDFRPSASIASDRRPVPGCPPPALAEDATSEPLLLRSTPEPVEHS
jgi:hypothetical protein